MNHKALCLLCTLGSLAAGAALDEVKIDTGKLKGAVAGEVVAFKGIPYAAPPVGVNRWRAPQPAAAWTGVRPATEFGSDCMQLPFPSDAAPLGTKPAEDCLFVNVWRPATAAAKLPVIVWIYGGGFVNGGSSPAVYDGSQFAKQGLVFVSFNYRLGRFGFFAHPALTKESAGGQLGNYTFMDQIAALQWVKRNIAAFGGDPAKVTIFGESAGGHSVFTLMTSPLAKGLFQQAIVESGGGRTLMGPMKTVADAEKVGVAFGKANGIEGEDAAALEKLRALPADAIVAKMNMATMNSPTYTGPVLDGKIIVETVEDAFLAGHQAKVPFMAGANSADIGFSFVRTMDEVFASFGDNKAKAAAVYNPDNSANVRAVGTMVAMDRMMIEPARFAVKKMAEAGLKAYEFRFSYVAESMRSAWKGAPHATEIPFVFNTVAARYGDKLAAADKATAEAALGYWSAFAKTGNPNGAGRASWPAYDAAKDILLDFSEKGPAAVADPWKARLDLIEGSSKK